jgi:hypothetical protein
MKKTSLSVIVDCPFKIYKTYSFTFFIHDKIKIKHKSIFLENCNIHFLVVQRLIYFNPKTVTDSLYVLSTCAWKCMASLHKLYTHLLLWYYQTRRQSNESLSVAAVPTGLPCMPCRGEAY